MTCYPFCQQRCFQLFNCLKLFKDLIFIKGSFESIFVEIENTNKKAIIGVIYRPPHINILDNFFENIQRILHNISSENETSYIMGDFNINLLSNTDLSINFIKKISSLC